MTEADYQHECSRAELLGLPKPERNEFFSRPREITSDGDEEENFAREMEAESETRENIHNIHGGLVELDSLLVKTQNKLDRIRTVYENFSNLFKVQVRAKSEEREAPGNEGSVACQISDTLSEESAAMQKKKNGKGDLDKLDMLINKAEKAQLSLSAQNKQLKKFLN